MHQQYLSIQDTHAPALANTRNPRMRYTRAPRRGLIVASQFFSFFIKIIVASWDTAISGWPTEKRTDSDKDRSKESTNSLRSRSAANGQLDICMLYVMRACVPRNYNSNRPNSLLFPANHTARHLMWLSKGWFSRFQNWWSRNKSWNTYLKLLNPGINPGIYIQPY